MSNGRNFGLANAEGGLCNFVGRPFHCCTGLQVDGVPVKMHFLHPS